MDQKSSQLKQLQEEKAQFSSFLYKLSFLRALDIVGLFLISFLFYYFIPTLLPGITYSYLFYLISFTLLSVLIQWYFNETKFFFILSSMHYFIILLVSSFYI